MVWHELDMKWASLVLVYSYNSVRYEKFMWRGTTCSSLFILKEGDGFGKTDWGGLWGGTGMCKKRISGERL